MPRCVDCGFLTLKHAQEEEYVAASRYFRDTGNRPNRFSGGPLLCLIEVIDLHSEVCKLPPESGNRELKVIHSDNQCKRFCPWVQGFTPTEHVEMMHAARMEELAEERRKNEAESHARLLQMQMDREDARDNNARKWQLFLAILSAVFGIGGVILGAYLASTPK
jgi:hypothetical protein